MAQATFKTTAMTDTVAPLMAVIAGTPVLTLEGELPVEFLQPGDRILTRAGARRLVQVAVSVVRNARVVRIAHGTLGVDCPTEDVTVSAAQQILVRDWRAKAMFGQPQAMIAASRLADGEYIRAETHCHLELFCFLILQLIEFRFDRMWLLY